MGGRIFDYDSTEQFSFPHLWTMFICLSCSTQGLTTACLMFKTVCCQTVECILDCNAPNTHDSTSTNSDDNHMDDWGIYLHISRKLCHTWWDYVSLSKVCSVRWLAICSSHGGYSYQWDYVSLSTMGSVICSSPRYVCLTGCWIKLILVRDPM